MLCKFTGGGPENGNTQEIADDVTEVKCTGLTPGFAEVYTRDPKRPKRFFYQGRVCTGPYMPGFDNKYESWEEAIADNSFFEKK